MHVLLTALNTKSMIKPNSLVYFLAQLHTCLHAERDKTISHIIVYIILHHTMVTASRFRMQKYTIKRLYANYILKCTIQFLFIKTLRVPDNWKDFRFQSENRMQYTHHQANMNTIEHAKNGLPFITLINGTL